MLEQAFAASAYRNEEHLLELVESFVVHVQAQRNGSCTLSPTKTSLCEEFYDTLDKLVLVAVCVYPVSVNLVVD